MKTAWQTFEDLAAHARHDQPPAIDVQRGVLAQIAPPTVLADEPLWMPVLLTSSLVTAAAVAVWLALDVGSGSDSALAGWSHLVLWNVR